VCSTSQSHAQRSPGWKSLVHEIDRC
jgi:hypothetical protein